MKLKDIVFKKTVVICLFNITAHLIRQPKVEVEQVESGKR